ncbi:endolytic transglycosylase MltG [Paenibacillus sp. J2TS4]|uniref:endolytic transglycosylase MltG n=1 Tax=Paenibacillus sp. J2TS4 TaxID=2807194 RepID=UPI001B06FBFA|nr:endolytic transglycosylase MltG [Paenibacillus sp. J2TS4]GIP31445.1 aminodeoxychorismate lyase [Paenibacillus sp. J2TS4]
MKNGHNNHSPNRKKRTGIGVFFSLLLLLVALGTVSGYIIYGMKPTPYSDQMVRLTIAPGTGSKQIADILHREGIIRNPWVFTGYLRFKQEGTRFQAGEYEMNPGMSFDDIIYKLNRGDIVKEEMMRFTIPEGFTIRQIADKLSEQNGVDAERFIELAQNPSMVDSPWLDSLPVEDPNLKYKLEGYLFPETYELNKDSSPEEIISRMLAEWDRKLVKLPEGWQSTMEERGLTFHQLLTLASLIEREVTVEDERPLVAGVIYNRIEQGMKLQIDATVQYSLDAPKERLYNKDLLVDSPYNTYANAGMPPGPIASPSLSSIEAALYPEQSNYLFYVTKKDGSQRHLFAETYAQHQKNIKESES